MPDSIRVPARLRPTPVTAAAQAFTPQAFRSGQVFTTMSWQEEGWGFRRTLGEFNQTIDWMGRAMSRIRLGAAELVPGAAEPQMLEDGPAAQLMEDFCGGIPGHSAFLRAITPQLLIPGEGWLIAERADPSVPLSMANWGVYSTTSIRVGGQYGFQVRVGLSTWRDLLPDNLPIRVHDPDPQWPWMATSNTEAAIPIMRRIFLIDQRIIAMMVSRLAMNGFLLIPQEGTISVPPQYKEAPDPFVAYLIDIASKNIANPGQASAGIPIPVKMAAEFIDKWKILKGDDPIPAELLDERQQELGRLADTLAVARERVTGGMGDQNHWGQWQASEEEVKITFSPIAELICGAVGKAYLTPMLMMTGQPMLGPHGGRLIAWYDAGELTARPDNSANALNLYDRMEISGTALRAASNFDETDAPNEAELSTMIWKDIARNNRDPDVTPIAIEKLTGVVVPPPAPGTAPASPTQAPAVTGTPASVPTPVAGRPATAAEPSATARPATGPPSVRPAAPPPPGGTPPRPAAGPPVVSSGAARHRAGRR